MAGIAIEIAWTIGSGIATAIGVIAFLAVGVALAAGPVAQIILERFGAKRGTQTSAKSCDTESQNPTRGARPARRAA